MATYEFNDQIKFLLPSGFMLTREENDDGEEVVKIISGEYENDENFDNCLAALGINGNRRDCPTVLSTGNN